MRRLLRSIVADLGDVVGECEDGLEAVTSYERLRPDVVLMDIKMTNVDGLEATRRIKATHPDARVIIVTEYDDTKLRAEARAAGAIAYVIKEDLFALRKLLENIRSGSDGME